MRTAENTYHTYLHIVQNTSCIKKPQVISGGGGVRTPVPSPRFVPVESVKIACKVFARVLDQ